MIFIGCSSPLKAIVLGKTDTGKKNIIFDLTAYETGFYHSILIPKENRVLIPCGQCVECRIQRSREWANRCMLELQYHDSAYFVTLTYNDAHVPRSYYSDPATGEAMTSVTLYKRDFQLFMKRLRKRFGDDHIRFFMAGEYGSDTFRPHYHAIIFGLHLDDLKHYKKSPQGFSYFTSESLQACWIDSAARFPDDPSYASDGLPLGYVVVAEVTWETCAYTARYVMKKRTGKESEFYDIFNILPEFTLMSRKPGIARQYYEDNPDLYEKEFINVSTEKGGLKFRPPRYFDKLYDLECPDEMAEIKRIRQKLASEAQKAKLSKTTLSADELRAVEHRKFEARIKTLRRPLE